MNCTHAWDAALIGSDGSVRACCYSAAVGDLTTQGFEEIWNGEAWRQLRSDLSQNIVSRVCQGAACKYVENTVAASDRGAVALRASPEPRAPAGLRGAWRRLTGRFAARSSGSR